MKPKNNEGNMNELELEARIWDVEQRLDKVEAEVDELLPAYPDKPVETDQKRLKELEYLVRMIWGWAKLPSYEWNREFKVPELNTINSNAFLIYVADLADDLLNGPVNNTNLSSTNQDHKIPLQEAIREVLPSLEGILDEEVSGTQHWSNKDGDTVTVMSFASDSSNAEAIRKFIKNTKELI